MNKFIYKIKDVVFIGLFIFVDNPINYIYNSGLHALFGCKKDVPSPLGSHKLAVDKTPTYTQVAA